MPLTLSRAFREGTFRTSEWSVSATAAGAAVVTLDIAAADLVNPALSCVFELSVFDATLNAWRHDRSAQWRGDPSNVDQPAFLFEAKEMAGKQIRVELRVPVRMRIGLRVTGV